MVFPTHSRHRSAVHFCLLSQLSEEYAAKRAALKAHLRTHPEDGEALRKLVRDGILQWNAAGIRRQPLTKALAPGSHEIGLLRTFYLSPRVNIVWDLDAKVGSSAGVEAMLRPGHRLVKALRLNGLAEIDDYGLTLLHSTPALTQHSPRSIPALLGQQVTVRRGSACSWTRLCLS